jgi:hypothetical protein
MLLRALARTFSLAAVRFQKTPLKYSWIRYLPIANEPCFALSTLPKLIQQALRKASILESSNKTHVLGSKAVFIPQTFRTTQGAPLLDITTSLHKNYNALDMDQFSWLGVTRMSHQTFLSDLRSYIALDSGQQFQKQALPWHAHLAQVLDESHEISTAQIAELSIVPLQDGRWVAAKNNSITYELPGKDVIGHVPPGLDCIQLVHKSASSNPPRLRLLQKLGITQLDSRQVCGLIIAQHKSDALDSYTSTVLNSHAVYLFQAQHNLKSVNSSKFPLLWLCTSGGLVKRASELYIDLPDAEDSMRLHLSGGPATNLLLHSDILQAVRGPMSGKWLRWLVDTLGVSPILRVASSSGGITEKFAYFLENRLPTISLRHLVKHWRAHFPNGSVPRGVSEAISSAEVAYDGSKKKKLGELSIACKELTSLAPKGLPFLNFQDSENESWRQLKAFGVGVPENYHFVRHCINILRGKQVMKKDVIPLYQLLQRCFGRDEHEIRYVLLTCP